LINGIGNTILDFQIYEFTAIQDKNKSVFFNVSTMKKVNLPIQEFFCFERIYIFT